MSSRLVPCLACHRHVRADAEACPFCLVPRPLAERLEAAPEPVPARMGSLAVMTFRAAALGVALNACGGEAEQTQAQRARRLHGTRWGLAPMPARHLTPARAARVQAADPGGIVIPTGGTPNMNTAGGGPVPIYRATPRG